MKEYVCINKYLGLCNRLNVLLGDMRIAKEIYNTKFCLYWKKYKYDFDELFDVPDEDICVIKNYDHNTQYLSTHVSINGIVQFPRVLEHDLKNLDPKKSDILQRHGGFLYNEIPRDYINSYTEYIKKLTPAKDIKSIVDKFSKKFHDDTISVHIRRGDFRQNKKRCSNLDEKYFGLMDYFLAKNPNQTFFVSSDESETENIYKQKYGNLIITYDHEYDESQYDEKTALICLLLLSKNKKILISPKSTYSQMAWWLGLCNAKVYVVGRNVLNKTIYKASQ